MTFESGVRPSSLLLIPRPVVRVQRGGGGRPGQGAGAPA